MENLEKKESVIINNIQFEYNSKYDWYDAVINKDGNELSVHLFDVENLELISEKVTQYINELNINKLKNIIFNKYYRNKETYDLGNITEQEFMNNLYLLSIQIDSNYVEYWFDDNDMFDGHNIVISKKHDEEEIIVTLEG